MIITTMRAETPQKPVRVTESLTGHLAPRRARTAAPRDVARRAPNTNQVGRSPLLNTALLHEGYSVEIVPHNVQPNAIRIIRPASAPARPENYAGSGSDPKAPSGSYTVGIGVREAHGVEIIGAVSCECQAAHLGHPRGGLCRHQRLAEGVVSWLYAVRTSNPRFSRAEFRSCWAVEGVEFLTIWMGSTGDGAGRASVGVLFARMAGSLLPGVIVESSGEPFASPSVFAARLESQAAKGEDDVCPCCQRPQPGDKAACDGCMKRGRA